MKIHFVDQQWLGEETKKIQQETFPAAGMEVVFHDWETEEEIINGAKDGNAIMVVAVPVSGKVIEALPNLKFIGRCGIGYDSVDLKTATEKGIPVCNVPDYCAYEVASHSFALMMALKRHLIPFMNRAKAGGYGQGTGYVCRRLSRQKLGLLGFGRIARELGKMAKGMGMEVLVYDPFITEVNQENVRLCSLEEVLREADIVSVHTPLTDSTRHMIGEKQLSMMKKDAVIINTSRGPVIDTKALLSALDKGEIGGAGLDVCEGEPLPADSQVFRTKNIIVTPHVAMYSEEAMADLHRKLTKQAVDVLSGKWTENIVNPEVKEKKNWK